jgi:hypothetical protein
MCRFLCRSCSFLCSSNVFFTVFLHAVSLFFWKSAFQIFTDKLAQWATMLCVFEDMKKRWVKLRPRQASRFISGWGNVQLRIPDRIPFCAGLLPYLLLLRLFFLLHSYLLIHTFLYQQSTDNGPVFRTVKILNSFGLDII